MMAPSLVVARELSTSVNVMMWAAKKLKVRIRKKLKVRIRDVSICWVLDLRCLQRRTL
jgi:hypothetical protein